MGPRRRVGGRRDHTQFDSPETRIAGFASSSIKTGAYTSLDRTPAQPAGRDVTENITLYGGGFRDATVSSRLCCPRKKTTHRPP